MSQRRTVMLEAAKQFNVSGTGSMSDNELDLLLGKVVCSWMFEEYEQLAPIDKIMYNMAYVYAYPIRGAANPGVKNIIELTKDPVEQEELQPLLLTLRKKALKWNGRKRDVFQDLVDDIGEFSNDPRVPHLIYYLAAWEPYTVMARKENSV